MILIRISYRLLRNKYEILISADKVSYGVSKEIYKYFKEIEQ